MITKFNENDLISFEERIAEAFNSGLIRAPVHLYSGNESEILGVFQDIREEDWVMCSWRSHYQCLLKGVPEELLFEEILSGRSISLCFPKHRIFSSAIVGGTLPIATGLAISIKKKGGSNRVHCFIGDMTAESGIAYECEEHNGHHVVAENYIVEIFA